MSDGTARTGDTSEMEDADLVEYLHDELDGSGRERVERRVSESPATASRLRQLQRREERLRTMLSHLDPDELSVRRSAHAANVTAARARAGGAGRRRQLLRAAAVIVLLGAAAMTVEPVRAALGGGLRTIARTLGLPAGGVTAPESEAAPPAALVTTTVAWTSAVFTVELPAGGGVVEARSDEVSSASIRHSENVPIVVTPTGVRIAASGATIAVVLPAGTALRVVHAGSATDHSLSAEALRIER